MADSGAVPMELVLLTLLGLPLGVLLRRKSIAVHADALGVLGVLRQNATNGRVIRRHAGKRCAFVNRSSSVRCVTVWAVVYQRRAREFMYINTGKWRPRRLGMWLRKAAQRPQGESKKTAGGRNKTMQNSGTAASSSGKP